MALLVYCVSFIDAEAVQVSTPVCEATAHARNSHGVRVYVSELRSADRCLEGDALKQSALSFHQALREILAKHTFLPFRFPTIFESEEALDRHLQEEAQNYTSSLERIGDAVQYELAGTWTTEAQNGMAQPISGRKYLERRQQQMARVSNLDGKLKTVAGPWVREWRSRNDRGTQRWFALVARGHTQQFVESLRGAGPSEGVRLRLSGPWPPSEFVDEKRAHE